MSELLPCPFCGGEAEKLTSIDGFTSIGCLNCNPFYGVMIQRNTEAEAIAAWNSRADYHGYEQAAIESWESIKEWNSRAERTCENIDKYPDYRFKCSECNCVLYYEDLDGESWVFVDGVASVPNYCPNCGSRVIA